MGKGRVWGERVSEVLGMQKSKVPVGSVRRTYYWGHGVRVVLGQGSSYNVGEGLGKEMSEG